MTKETHISKGSAESLEQDEYKEALTRHIIIKMPKAKTMTES